VMLEGSDIVLGPCSSNYFLHIVLLAG
jgi:hypothetical protein